MREERLLAEHASEAKVPQLHCAVAVDEYVGGFDVAV
jgi:hypothetical protein